MTWQPAPILYPDAELTACTKLRALLVARGYTDVFVGREVPNPRRDRMVILTRDGGAPLRMLDRPRLRVRVWDETDKKAQDLAALVIALVPRMVDGDPIASARTVSGPYDVTDESKKPQKYALLELTTRGTYAA